MTEDHAYKMLWDTWEYLERCKRRVWHDQDQRALIIESATACYKRWQAEVKKFQDAKRSQLVNS